MPTRPALGQLLGALLGLPGAYASAATAMVLPALVTAASATLIAALARERGAGSRDALLAALAFVFGTELLTISRTLFAEPLGAACLALCAWGLLAPPGDRRRHALAALAAALVVMTKPQLLFAAPLAGLALALVDRRVRPAILALAGTFAGSLAVLGYNWYRFGDPTDFGGSSRKLYVGGSPDGSSPIVELLDGAAQLLVSPNHGLLVFGPVALLGLVGLMRRPLDRVAAVCLGGALGVFGFALFEPNGNFWGTRYLVPLLPLACVGVAALGRRGRWVAIMLVVATAVSQAPNLVSYPERLRFETGAPLPQAWDVGRLTVVDVWPSALHQLRAASRTDPASLVKGADPAVTDEFFRVVAQWWWMLPAVGIPAILGAGVSLLVLVAGGWLVVQSVRPRAPVATGARSG